MPSARPRGMMVALWMGSEPTTFNATMAWPPSWKAVSFFSSSLIAMERRSAPIMTLSLASSSSVIMTTRLPRRAARSAASLTRLARSAPEKPGVPRARMRGSTSGANAVQLDQQLVEGLFALVVAAAEAGAAMTADRVDFVDEDDARRVLLGLLEHVTHARGTDADEHLDEVGA